MSDLDYDPLMKRIHAVLLLFPAAETALDTLDALEVLRHIKLARDLRRRFFRRQIFSAKDLHDLETLLGPITQVLEAEWRIEVINDEGMVQAHVERTRTCRGAEVHAASRPLYALRDGLIDIFELRHAEEIAMALRQKTPD